MAETTARLGLPLIQAGQAQKEIFHNEALARLDALVQAAVEGAPQDAPPSSPAAGQSWIVGTSPSGGWAGRAHAIATWTGGGWRFTPARAGMTAWVADAGSWAVRGADGWQVGAWPVASIRVGGVQVVGTRRPAIADPAGGGTVDLEARAAVAALLAAVRAHGLIAT